MKNSYFGIELDNGLANPMIFTERLRPILKILFIKILWKIIAHTQLKNLFEEIKMHFANNFMTHFYVQNKEFKTSIKIFNFFFQISSSYFPFH